MVGAKKLKLQNIGPLNTTHYYFEQFVGATSDGVEREMGFLTAGRVEKGVVETENMDQVDDKLI